MRKSPRKKVEQPAETTDTITSIAESNLVKPSADFLEALRLHAKGYFGVSNKYLRVTNHGRPPYKTTMTISAGVYRELKELTWKKFREDAARDERHGR